MRRLALAVVLLLLALPAAAATVIEARIGDAPIRIVSDDGLRRVLVEGSAGRRLVDLAEGAVYVTVPDQPTRKVTMFGMPSPAGEVTDFTILQLGPGPRIAGYPTTRFRLMLGQTACTELYANLGLGMELSQVMAAFELLDRFNGLVQGPARPACERIPFRSYSRLGWSLMVKDTNGPTVNTVMIERDVKSGLGELAIPADAVDITDLLKDRVQNREGAE